MGAKPGSVLPTVASKTGILSRPLLKVRNPAFQVGNRGFKSPGRDHMSSSSNRLGNRPLTSVIGVRAPKRMPIGRALKSPIKRQMPVSSLVRYQVLRLKIMLLPSLWVRNPPLPNHRGDNKELGW